jgi:hypothetical protein
VVVLVNDRRFINTKNTGMRISTWIVDVIMPPTMGRRWASSRLARPVSRGSARGWQGRRLLSLTWGGGAGRLSHLFKT